MSKQKSEYRHSATISYPNKDDLTNAVIVLTVAKVGSYYTHGEETIVIPIANDNFLAEVFDYLNTKDKYDGLLTVTFDGETFLTLDKLVWDHLLQCLIFFIASLEIQDVMAEFEQEDDDIII